MWHASISLRDAGGNVVPVERMTRKERRMALDFARDLLAGVGAGRSVESAMTLIHQVRRAVSPEEYAKLDPAWRSLEPVDRGG